MRAASTKATTKIQYFFFYINSSLVDQTSKTCAAAAISSRTRGVRRLTTNTIDIFDGNEDAFVVVVDVDVVVVDARIAATLASLGGTATLSSQSAPVRRQNSLQNS